MTGGKNGATPFENLTHLQSKRVYADNAEPIVPWPDSRVENSVR